MILITEERYNRLLKGQLKTEPEENNQIPVKTENKNPVKAEKTKVKKTQKRKLPPPPGVPEDKRAKRVLKFERF